MGWERAHGRLYAAKVDTVRMSCREVVSHRRTKGTRNSLIFYIGFSVARKLGWSDQTRINLFWGDGADHGWCRIEVAHDGRFKVRQTHKRGVKELCGFYFKTQQHPLDAGGVFPAEECKHVVTPDGALQIKPPTIFWRTYDKKRPDENIGRPRKLPNERRNEVLNGRHHVAPE